MKYSHLAALALLLVPTLPGPPHQANGQTPHRPDVARLAAAAPAAKPYQDNNGAVPPKSVYTGPLFTLSHAWPAAPLPKPVDPPWQKAINSGKINTQNASAYAAALKAAVADNARNLIMNYDTWDAARAGWYNEPWLGSIREAIRVSAKPECPLSAKLECPLPDAPLREGRMSEGLLLMSERERDRAHGAARDI